MKSILLAGFIFFGVLNHSWSSDLHVLITAATDDPSIGTSVEVDAKAIEGLAKRISKATGLTLKLQVLKGTDFNVKNFRAMIQNLNANSNDIIFYYNSSHGYRSKQKTNQWPFIYIPDAPGDWDLAWIHEQLSSKGARLTIVAGDQCNSFIDQKSAPVDMPNEIPSERALPGEGKNLKSLFLDARGSILASASKPGEYSWGDIKGGSFTRAFLRSILANVKNDDNSNWKEIFDNACKVQFVNGKKMSPQYKFFNLSEGSVAKEDAPLRSYSFQDGSFRQTSKYNFTLNHNGKIYQLETYRPTTSRYFYLVDNFNGGWYSLDLIENDLWYWPKDGSAWAKWRELTPTGWTATLANYGFDGGTISQTGKSDWLIIYNNTRYELKPYKVSTSKYHYLYDAKRDDWYQLGLIDGKLWYWNKKTEAWEVWRTITPIKS